MNSTTMSMPFELAQISSFVYSITELDPWDYNPLMYLIVGDEKGVLAQSLLEIHFSILQYCSSTLVAITVICTSTSNRFPSLPIRRLSW